MPVHLVYSRGHREELDRIAEKSKFQKNVNELMKRSEQLTITTEELEKTKFELGEASITNRMLNDELQDTVRLDVKFARNIMIYIKRTHIGLFVVRGRSLVLLYYFKQ